MIQKLTLIDTLIDELQHGIKTCHLQPPLQERPYPASNIDQQPLSGLEQQLVAGLMRVNNAGEVAAQGLYRGQGLTARDTKISVAMQAAAEEENEHLNWCQQRLTELGQGRSKLDGIWYWGSFAIGAIAGMVGDKWSLGFVRETEQQVYRHLEDHLSRLPEDDQRSRIILETMKKDEMQHAINAQKAGAADLPKVIKCAMSMVSKVMTFTAYRI
ncbi:MAG: 2-polyprenyl-3-methyl-6-methoxy-1,4-benzoquinone monooxygenase [Gammaproteobacteria bacterium]